VTVELEPPHEEPGWTGAFTRQQAPGALFANTTRIRKDKSERGDATPLGTEGTVLGSYYVPERGFAYFVEWDDKPRLAVLVLGWKLARAQPDS
jgi:hypothetical protein